jgi:RNA 3'-terminal phosphate cyclase (ATP)
VSITIDGGRGEGGGQIVRTSLTLSCITGRPLRMINVRAGRPKPGLANQHLTAIRAAQQISSATVTGAGLGSKQFTFEPGPVQPGEYSFDVGTAGSTTLVLQTIALPLAFTTGDSTVTIIGGTHNPMAPCYEYLESVWAPLLALTGIHIYLQIKRAGFYPAGGGRIEATIVGLGSATSPTASPRLGGEGRASESRRAGSEGLGLKPVSIDDRGEIYSIDGFSAVARLPLSIAERQARQAELRLSAAGIVHHPITCQTIDAASPGTVLFLNCRCRGAPAAFFGLGARGKPAERVADEAVDQLVDQLSHPGALDPHAADQFVLPLALARGASSFTTTTVTDHLVTHIDLLRQFLRRQIELTGRLGETGEVRITG